MRCRKYIVLFFIAAQLVFAQNNSIESVVKKDNTYTLIFSNRVKEQNIYYRVKKIEDCSYESAPFAMRVCELFFITFDSKALDLIDAKILDIQEKYNLNSSDSFTLTYSIKNWEQEVFSFGEEYLIPKQVELTLSAKEHGKLGGIFLISRHEIFNDNTISQYHDMHIVQDTSLILNELSPQELTPQVLFKKKYRQWLPMNAYRKSIADTLRETMLYRFFTSEFEESLEYLLPELLKQKLKTKNSKD